MSVPASTTFRDLMTHLISPRGAEAEWPLLLKELLIAEFLRQKNLGFRYAGEVFKDRDEDDWTAAVLPEKKAVKELFHHCRSIDGVIRIDSEPFWLLGYEWPNQTNDRGRRADLIGLNTEGGLVVFECKLSNNSYGPFASLLEGLDYLTCLVSELNFSRIQEGFTRWSSKPGRIIPNGFSTVTPNSMACHEVVVLAPEGYYGLYTRSARGIGWQQFASLPFSRDLSLRFAVSDFHTSTGTWAK